MPGGGRGGVVPAPAQVRQPMGQEVCPEDAHGMVPSGGKRTRHHIRDPLCHRVVLCHPPLYACPAPSRADWVEGYFWCDHLFSYSDDLETLVLMQPLLGELGHCPALLVPLEELDEEGVAKLVYSLLAPPLASPCLPHRLLGGSLEGWVGGAAHELGRQAGLRVKGLLVAGVEGHPRGLQAVRVLVIKAADLEHRRRFRNLPELTCIVRGRPGPHLYFETDRRLTQRGLHRGVLLLADQLEEDRLIGWHLPRRGIELPKHGVVVPSLTGQVTGVLQALEHLGDVELDAVLAAPHYLRHTAPSKLGLGPSDAQLGRALLAYPASRTLWRYQRLQ